MNRPAVVSRDEWQAARDALLAREKELTRLHDQLAAERRALPWVKIEKEYSFDAPEGKVTLADLFAWLRTDPQFFYPDGPSLFEAYAAMAKRVDPLLVRLFRTLPRTPYGVEAIPEAMAPDTTAAYYREPAADGSRAGRYRISRGPVQPFSSADSGTSSSAAPSSL